MRNELEASIMLLQRYGRLYIIESIQGSRGMVSEGSRINAIWRTGICTTSGKSRLFRFNVYNLVQKANFRVPDRRAY